jgi:hypothetical protein
MLPDVRKNLGRLAHLRGHPHYVSVHGRLPLYQTGVEDVRLVFGATFDTTWALESIPCAVVRHFQSKPAVPPDTWLRKPTSIGLKLAVAQGSGPPLSQSFFASHMLYSPSMSIAS